jgi:hypothetical protein
MEDARDDHRPSPPQSPGFPSTLTVNVNFVVSGTVTLKLDGHAIVELLSSTGDLSSEAARLTKVAARFKTSSDALKAAEDSTGDPKP